MADESNIIVPNTSAAIDFLKHWYGDHERRLYSIVPDGKMTAAVFSPAQEEKMRRWIDERQGKQNLYYQVNRVYPDRKAKKASDGDIESIVCAHVDYDGADALEVIAGYAPPPTLCVNSGNGFNAYWLYTTAIAEIEVARRKNYALGIALGADSCHDPSRILRLVGTINMPNKKKRERGCVPVLATIVDEWTDWNRLYDPEDFDEVEIGTAKKENLPVKLISVDDLPDQLSEDCKAIILHGDDPERSRSKPNARYSSRSEALFYVVCNLLRAGCDEKQICGIIENPAYKISESVLQRKVPRDYAMKQIRHAKSKQSDDWPDGVTKEKKPKRGYANAHAALLRLGVVCSYNSFNNRLYISGHQLQSYQGELDDNLCAMLRQLILEHYHFDAGKENVRDAVHTLCLENAFHPVREYLNSLRWDGVPRIEGMLRDYFGAKDTAFIRAVSKIVMVAAVRRIRDSGAKFDFMLVLEGIQGTGKSSAIALLAGQENFSDQDLLSADSKTQMEMLEGVWLYEICELEGMNKAEASRIKAFISRTEDRARPAYARFRENRPRHTIFIGTTNEQQYLKDDTGNRRFWPVATGAIDLDRLKEDRDQLWAEAAALEAAGEPIGLPRELWAEAEIEQDMRMQDDNWLDILREVEGIRHAGFWRVTTSYLLEEKLKIQPDKQNRYHTTRLGIMMRKLGWDGPKNVRLPNKPPMKGYERPIDGHMEQQSLPITGKSEGDGSGRNGGNDSEPTEDPIT